MWDPIGSIKENALPQREWLMDLVMEMNYQRNIYFSIQKIKVDIKNNFQRKNKKEIKLKGIIHIVYENRRMLSTRERQRQRNRVTSIEEPFYDKEPEFEGFVALLSFS